MALEENPDAKPFQEFRGTVSEYTLHKWRQTHTHGDYFEKHYKGAKKATNPPTIFEYGVSIISLHSFSEDGEYPIPASTLGDGVVSGVQYRTLIGVEWMP